MVEKRAPQRPLWLVGLAAWLVPGAGHLLLARFGRAGIFFALVLFSAAFGASLEGKLFEVVAEQPLSRLGTLASMGMGAPYFVLRWVLEYEGNIRAVTYEYGGAFLLTAGLMNLLLILDSLDIASGSKS